MGSYGEEYSKEIEAFRESKDHFFRHDSDSPMPQRHGFKGLSYFPPDPHYRVGAKFVPDPKPQSLRMLTSKGVEQDFHRVGHLEFTLEGKPLKLAAYRSARAHAHDESLFTPFRDTTSGKESYGAARYLDLHAESSSEHVLDFNLAYNPYCAYSDAYICPFPPPENWLPVAIRAGEKVWKD